MELPVLLEALMVISFGVSWPTSIAKSLRARTAKGKSLFFLCLILFGYICGVLSKLMAQNISYIVVVYALNLVMVGIDLCLYFRNRRLDRERENFEAEALSAKEDAPG